MRCTGPGDGDGSILHALVNTRCGFIRAVGAICAAGPKIERGVLSPSAMDIDRLMILDGSSNCCCVISMNLPLIGSSRREDAESVPA